MKTLFIFKLCTCKLIYHGEIKWLFALFINYSLEWQIFSEDFHNIPKYFVTSFILSMYKSKNRYTCTLNYCATRDIYPSQKPTHACMIVKETKQKNPTTKNKKRKFLK